MYFFLLFEVGGRKGNGNLLSTIVNRQVGEVLKIVHCFIYYFKSIGHVLPHASLFAYFRTATINNGEVNNLKPFLRRR